MPALRLCQKLYDACYKFISTIKVYVLEFFINNWKIRAVSTIKYVCCAFIETVERHLLCVYINIETTCFVFISTIGRCLLHDLNCNTAVSRVYGEPKPTFT
jgi:hypothetical protein